jgi:hypothetical protein
MGGGIGDREVCIRPYRRSGVYSVAEEKPMRPTVGIFTSRKDAEQAIEQLQSVGIPPDQVNLLSPGASKEEIHDVPTSESEQPGMGKTIGGVVGGALGMQLGAALSIIIPGIGPVIATGLIATALLGAIGAVSGAAAGGALETSTTEGLPVDELYVYEDALRQGRTILIALADDETQADAAREALAQAGVESLDAARKNWWVGLRSAEELEYTRQGRDFKTDEPNYRRGFEAALNARTRGKSYQEAGEYLRERYPDAYDQESFRRGYERGQAYYRAARRKENTDGRA